MLVPPLLLRPILSTLVASTLSSQIAFPADDPLVSAGELIQEIGKENTRDWKHTLMLLRFADALRLTGKNAEAVSALDTAAKHNAKVSSDSSGDEIAAELCRLFALAGETGKALAVAETATTRNYEMLGILLAAQSLAEEERKGEFETMVRGALARVEERGLRSNDDQWLRGMVLHSIALGLEPLAREVTAAIQNDFWRSAALSEFGDEKSALSCPDLPMRVLALARIGSLQNVLDVAEEISDSTTRDEALRAAARIFADAGETDDAEQVALAISDPATRLLAFGPFLEPSHAEVISGFIEQCPEEDRVLLAEGLAVAAGRRGQVELVERFAAMIPEGPARFRALKSAIALMKESGSQKSLLDSAGRLLIEHPDSFGRELDRARLELAIRFHEAGAEEKVGALLGQVKPGISWVEAALLVGKKDDAASAIFGLLPRATKGDNRDRLLALLVEAGSVEKALVEVSEELPDEGQASHLLAAALFENGAVDQAWEFVERLEPEDRIEALIAMSMSGRRDRQAAKDSTSEVVAVTSHGSWRPWYPRLERLGIPWAAMPFMEPFEIGANGLSQRYAALGYPGGNSHRDHTAASGIEAIRGFLDTGGGFVGICAGQFLATHCDLIPMDSVYHPRGDGPHQVVIVKKHPVAQSLPPVIVINRRNGGFLDPGPGATAIGWYDSEERYAALAAADRWDGRVVVFSPHPEGSSGFDPRDRLCNNALRWAVWGTP